jgi:hypothetical protein
LWYLTTINIIYEIGVLENPRWGDAVVQRQIVGAPRHQSPFAKLSIGAKQRFGQPRRAGRTNQLPSSGQGNAGSQLLKSARCNQLKIRSKPTGRPCVQVPAGSPANVLELARSEYVSRRENIIAAGNSEPDSYCSPRDVIGI